MHILYVRNCLILVTRHSYLGFLGGVTTTLNLAHLPGYTTSVSFIVVCYGDVATTMVQTLLVWSSCMVLSPWVGVSFCCLQWRKLVQSSNWLHCSKILVCLSLLAASVDLEEHCWFGNCSTGVGLWTPFLLFIAPRDKGWQDYGWFQWFCCCAIKRQKSSEDL